MSKLREIFDLLSQEDQEMILCYLDRDEDHYIEVAPNEVIGIYLERNPDVIIEMKEGPWSYGRLSK